MIQGILLEEVVDVSAQQKRRYNWYYFPQYNFLKWESN